MAGDNFEGDGLFTVEEWAAFQRESFLPQPAAIKPRSCTSFKIFSTTPSAVR
jgi:hypothetical protein